MRFITLSIVYLAVLISSTAALSLPTTWTRSVTDPSEKFPRSQPTCDNSLSTIAGTYYKSANPPKLFGPRSFLHPSSISKRRLTPRWSTSTVLWCAPESTVYLILKPAFIISGTLVPNLLISAYASIEIEIDMTKDMTLPGGFFRHIGGNGLALNAWTAAESTLLLSEMASACAALMDYMNTNGYGTLSFIIKDGGNEIGEGYLGYH